MSLTTTYVPGAVTASAAQFTLNAFTNPSTGGISAKTLLRFGTGEYCLVTDASLSPTIQVVRGYYGSMAVAHNAYEGVQYGLIGDSAWPTAVPLDLTTVPAVSITNAAEMTATGTTGTNAAPVTAPWPAFLDVTGTSGTGINLPIPSVGAVYWVKNLGTGALNVYCVGGTIEGTTGTTAVTITATGNLGESFQCATSGVWRRVPVAT